MSKTSERLDRLEDAVRRLEVRRDSAAAASVRYPIGERVTARGVHRQYAGFAHFDTDPIEVTGVLREVRDGQIRTANVGGLELRDVEFLS